MCYFDGFPVIKRQKISKTKALPGWKVLNITGDGKQWHSPLCSGYKGGVGKVGKWEQAGRHGYYVFKTRDNTRRYLGHLRISGSICKVLIAGDVREYSSGYRARWIKVIHTRG